MNIQNNYIIPMTSLYYIWHPMINWEADKCTCQRSKFFMAMKMHIVVIWVMIMGSMARRFLWNIVPTCQCSWFHNPEGHNMKFISVVPRVNLWCLQWVAEGATMILQNYQQFPIVAGTRVVVWAASAHGRLVTPHLPLHLLQLQLHPAWS